MPSALIDELTQNFLSAIQTGGTRLAIYSLLILALAGTIAYYREYATIIMHGTGLGDALAGLVTYVMAALTYGWVAGRLWEMGMAVLGAAIQWGSEMSGYGFSLSNLQTPSFILDIGLKLAFPSLQFGTWWQKMWSFAN